MSIGIGAGALLRSRKRLFIFVDRITVYAIWLLLFLLGLSIGTNDVIVKNIGTLGLQAIVTAVVSIGLSVLLSYFLYHYLFTHEE